MQKTKYEQNKECAKRYNAKLDMVSIRIPKGKKEEYKAYAESQGKSLAQTIIDFFENALSKQEDTKC